MNFPLEQAEALSPTKRALLAIKQLQAKLEALERAKTEPIAIVGMGCRFPGHANHPEAFWQLLQQGVEAITDIPSDRWNINACYNADPTTPGTMYTRRGGFVPHLQEFDAQFFRVAPREAISLDPQQRLLLEVSWEALENAGLAAEQLIGTPAGVFIGICSIDYWHRLLSRNPENIDAYLTTGNTHSVASGRLSYVLGLTGPSLSIDTACSSSLAAVHLACQSLRNQECNLALAGGVNRILSPEISINFSKAQMLSPDDRCRSFDAAANGFVRAEGCGVIVLKRLSDAIAAGDPIQAVILGSAVNHDGRTSGLTVPNGPAQQAVIRQALSNSQIEPSQVSYVEAHGTGTALGDPIEVGALGEVFKDRSAAQPLQIGSVKPNIGHLEAAAGIASLIKVVLALQHQEIPANLYFQTPNPQIRWQELPVSVPTQPVPWPSGAQQRVAGVSAFGFNGTNTHVVLAEAPTAEPAEPLQNPTSATRPLHLLTLSARTAAALKQLVSDYEAHLTQHPDLAIEDICFTATTGRSHFNHRLAVIADSTADLRKKLAVWPAEHPAKGIVQGQLSGGVPLKLVFLFLEPSSQLAGLGQQLYQTQPIFRAAIDRCRQILPFAQPNRFALEHALAELWRSWGIQPTALLGQGTGEYVAASVAGVFSLEEGLRLLLAREALLQPAADSQQDTKQRLTAFQEILHSINYAKPQIPIVSGVTGDIVGAEIATPDYWHRQAMQPAKLTEAIETLHQFGCQAYMQMLTSSETAALPRAEALLPGLCLGQEDWFPLLQTLAWLYVQGATVDWSGFNQAYFCRKVVLPTYPFQRQRYGIEAT